MRRVILLFLLLVSVTSASFAQTTTAGKAATPRATTAIVNLNTATASELEGLPGIGPKVAARIVEYRQKNGPFKKIEELMNVQGIGEKSFLKLRTQLTVSGKTDSPSHQ